MPVDVQPLIDQAAATIQRLVDHTTSLEAQLGKVGDDLAKKLQDAIQAAEAKLAGK